MIHKLTHYQELTRIDESNSKESGEKKTSTERFYKARINWLIKIYRQHELCIPRSIPPELFNQMIGWHYSNGNGSSEERGDGCPYLILQEFITDT